MDTAQPQAEETANQPDTNQTQSPREDAFLTVRYNKQELPLSREAAAEYAQKGLNYDKLSGRLSEAAGKLKEYEHIDTLAEEWAEQSGLERQQALDLVRQSIINEGKKQAEVNSQLDQFLEERPDVDVSALPEAVMDAWKSGVPLNAAYSAYQNISEKQQIAQKANEQNAASSMGSVSGGGAALPKPLSEETIAHMTPAELEDNHSRIWAFLTGQKE